MHIYILFLLPIALWCGLVSPILRTNWYYITATISLSSLIFLYIFPFFTKWMHTTPVYFENLHDPSFRTKKEQEHYQRIFMHIMNVFLTILLCTLFNYAIYQTDRIQITPIAILTIIGSLCGLHSKVQSNVGSVLMAILHFSKERKRKDSNSEIELGQIGEYPSKLKQMKSDPSTMV
jgi:hypothetical protein